MSFNDILGAILLVFAGGVTTSSVSEKFIELSNKNDDLESSSLVVANPVKVNQKEEEEKENGGDLKAKGLKLSDLEDEDHKKKGSKEEEKEEEGKEEKTQSTIFTVINETDGDILEDSENVSSIAMTTIESTSSSPFLDNELGSFDRMEKLNIDKYVEEVKNVDNMKNVSMNLNETKSTTSIPVPTLPVVLSSSMSNVIVEKKLLESSKANLTVATTTGDASIYENTIGRKDSEKKPIVTEPSVVLENSIQQSGAFGSSYKTINYSTIESTSSLSSSSSSSSTSTESSSIGTLTIGTLTTGTLFPYVQSESDNPNDLTGNGITESTNSNTIVSMTTIVPVDSSILDTKTTDPTTKSTLIDDYYSTLSTGIDNDFSTETTIESSDQSSVNPTTSSSSYSGNTVEYKFVTLTENNRNSFTTTTLAIEDTLSIDHEQTDINISNNVSDSKESTRSLSEIESWPRSTSVERTLPITPSPNAIITSSTIRSTLSSTENNMMTSVESTTESLEATPLVNVVTLDLPSSTFVTTFLDDKSLGGKKSVDVGIPTTIVATIMETLPPDEITSLVRIMFENNRHNVCLCLEELRQFLADILSNGLDKVILAKQVRFHKNPCTESDNSKDNSSSEESFLTIYVYIVNENGRFDAAMTKILPNLYKSSVSNFPITIHSLVLVQEIDSSNAIAVVVVSSVAFICLLLLAGLLFVMRKRQTRFNYGERCRPVSLDAYSLDSVSAYNSVRRKGVARSSKRSYGNPAFEDSSAVSSHPLNFTGLTSFSNDVDAINEEFLSIPQVSAKMDELPLGAEVKNRYANVIPLPESRVPLKKLNDDPLSEYINASYVRGPKNATKYYIACQAPLDTTVTDFWRMIWEQQSKVIIMLTDLFENGVEKCTEYIPPSEVTDCHRLYGDFQVTLKKRETKEKYAISTLHLKVINLN
ncbi:serine-rich adhesin for platelets-like [Vespula squamosa]|uniref:protein-tyrosine-phosphatase n=1 Tax=Vespula squamosa TaxID=30214 RepID=A0ABD2AXF0_VESSQ